ncbi:MAG TPA: hypothetical protein VFS67_12030 [Polyangiaceae bacterium]|nr:hypothetical protein [Polyangiaceae bacterium]
MTAYAPVLERVAELAERLPAEERGYAERVVGICRALAERERLAGKLSPAEGDLELKRELGRLAELLGRRSTQALPAASLGRAALADLSFDLRNLQALCSDCDAKLALLGR